MQDGSFYHLETFGLYNFVAEFLLYSFVKYFLGIHLFIQQVYTKVVRLTHFGKNQPHMINGKVCPEEWLGASFCPGTQRHGIRHNSYPQEAGKKGRSLWGPQTGKGLSRPNTSTSVLLTSDFKSRQDKLKGTELGLWNENSEKRPQQSISHVHTHLNLNVRDSLLTDGTDRRRDGPGKVSDGKARKSPM